MPVREKNKLHLLVTSAYPNSVAGFRGDLIRACVAAGSQVTVLSATAEPEVEHQIRSLKCEFHPYSIKRNAINVSSDLKTLGELKTAYRELSPDIILAYTIKPIIWGGIAARKVPNARFFALVTGLGYAFQGTSLKRRLLNGLVTWLYRFALRGSEGVIFQNRDNRDLFVRHNIVAAEKCHVVNGSGVNVASFSKAALPAGPAHFLVIARLLGEKGIREYCRAAEIVKRQYPDCIFSVVGPKDPSPDGINIEEINQWHQNNTIVYHGATSDVQPFIKSCHVYTLPSYHEGMPRTVLESMAMGRPILTTDVVGCRETVEPGVNGQLVPKGDAEALALKMIWFIENRDQWQAMGDASRKIAEEKFDVHKVNQQMLKILGIGQITPVVD